MKREVTLRHEFVEYMPDQLQDGIIYVSITFATAAHKCCCGCGKEVVTPLSPTDWKLIFDGESISLDPSIGNWSFPCRSHYWIERNRVRWARHWSNEQIQAGRVHDALVKQRHFGTKNAPETPVPVAESAETAEVKTRENKQSLWSRLKSWWS